MASFGPEELVAAAASGDTSSLTAAADAAGAPFIFCVSFPLATAHFPPPSSSSLRCVVAILLCTLRPLPLSEDSIDY